MALRISWRWLIILANYFFVYTAIADSIDETTLTLELQRDRIELDQSLYSEVNQALTIIRTNYKQVSHIHTHSMKEIHTEIIVETKASWSKAWEKGVRRTGIKEIDDLAETYGLESTGLLFENLFILKFSNPLKTNELAKLYESFPYVESANPNSMVGDGDDITVLDKGRYWLFVFKEGAGDCPSGCIEESYYYIKYDREKMKAEWKHQLPSSKSRSGQIHLWGIPDRKSLRAFKSFDNLVEVASSSFWWERLHAIDVIAFLLEGPKTPRYGEDFEPEGHFDKLKKEVLDNRITAINVLETALSDPDSDVRLQANKLYAAYRSLQN